MSAKPTYEELEQKTEELRASERQKRDILDASIDMIMQYDTDLRIVWANKKAASVINKTVNDIVGHKCHKIFQGKDTPCSGCPCLKALQTGNVENEIMRHSAMEIVGDTYRDNYAVPTKNNNGQIIGITEIARDITERKQAEVALRESEERLKDFINLATDSFVFFDSELNILRVSKAHMEMFHPGMDKDDLIGKNLLDIVPNLKETGRFDDFMKVIETGTPFFSDDIIPQQKFGNKYLSVKAFKMADGLGTITRDITDRKRAERELLESKERFRLLSEASFEGVLIHDKGKILDGNQTFANIFGYKLDEIIGMNVLELAAPESRDVVKNNVLSGFEQAYEAVGLRKDGSTFPGELRGGQIEYKGNTVRLTAARDLSEQKKSEETLRESEAKYRILAENAKDIIWVRDMDLKLKYVSPSVEKVCGYTPEEAMVQTIEEVLTPESAKTAADLFSRMFQMKDDERPDQYLVELEHYCKNGQSIWLELKISWLYDSNGERSGILGASRDITERKQLEDQLRQSHKMEAIGTLTGGVAHDFNNILGIIIGNTELALDDVPEWNPAYFNLEDIKVAGLRAAGIVKQLLNFSRKTDHEMRPIGVITVIKDALKFLRSTIPATIEIRKNILNTDETILADPTQINQIIMNLCVNASHEMEKTGGIMEITVEKITLDEEAADSYPDFTKGDYVKLAISDTGSGIDPEIIDRIFDPYFTTKEVGKGSGMGLFVVHGIVKNHNGAITVDSELGKGTTFTILFSIVTEKSEIKAETTDNFPLGSETILFVDDEKSIVDIAGRMLERLGYKVETEISPVEALKLFQSKPDQFDLIITDMTMPQMTGVKLYKKLMEIRSDIPVIICTGHSSLIDEESAKEMGIAAYVMKPIVKQNIAETIRRVLDK